MNFGARQRGHGAPCWSRPRRDLFHANAARVEQQSEQCDDFVLHQRLDLGGAQSERVAPISAKQALVAGRLSKRLISRLIRTTVALPCLGMWHTPGTSGGQQSSLVDNGAKLRNSVLTIAWFDQLGLARLS